jgi:antitoxin component of MazEF toxin-antitoxin module
MSESIVRARKLGGSLVVTIPKEVAMQEGIVEGEAVRLRVKRVNKDWFGALKGVGPFTKEDELDEMMKELGIKRSNISSEDVIKSRKKAPKGLTAGKVIREMRDDRARRISR